VQVTLSLADPVQITGRSHQIDDRLGNTSPGTEVLDRGLGSAATSSDRLSGQLRPARS